MTEGHPQPLNLRATQPAEFGLDKLWHSLGIVGLYVLTLLAYLPATKALFIWDDDYYVLNNTALKTFDGLQRIWIGIAPDAHNYPVPQYYPVTLTSFWLEYRIWGLNPVGYHVVNILLHATSAWVLWVVVARSDPRS